MIPENRTIKKLILRLFNDIFTLGMCFQKTLKKTAFLVFIGAFFCSCEAMDTLLPSSGYYKVGLYINDIPLDECSFVGFSDKLYPCFEEPVSGDKDVTALVVFLRNSSGEVAGQKISYSISSDNTYDVNFPVKNLDENLSSFPVPANLPMGKYFLNFHVMSGKNILQRTERAIYYLGEKSFSFNGINMYMPGITEAPQVIPKDTNIMLEAVMDFDGSLNPYIIWYDGKRKISEGKISDGAGMFFWQAPEQSGFFSLRAEVFPNENLSELKGYQNEVSMLVTSKSKDFDLISEDIPQMTHWYTFEGNLNDSKTASAVSALKPASGNIPVWKGVNGTYGLITGQNNVISLPKVRVPNGAIKTWQTLFRFKTLDDGVIFSVFFGDTGDISLSLIKNGKNLLLVLQSFQETVSQVLNLPVGSIISGLEPDIEDPFITAGIIFSVQDDRLSAQLNLMGVTIENEINSKPMSLKSRKIDGFQIVLGFTGENVESPEEPPSEKRLTALWDEFALYYMPSMKTIIAKLRPTVNEN